MVEYSSQIKISLAETLAIISSNEIELRNVTAKSKWVPRHIVWQLLNDAPSERWIKLGPQLPTLAEAAPEEFLRAMEQLLKDGERVASIYAKEDRGFMGGGNPMVGILWALETLAWSPEYLSEVTLVLGGLDVLDPGGSWGDRAKASLTQIFLPWYPQTSASLEKRKSALAALAIEHPATGWAVYLSLLPGATSSSSETHKPKWRSFGQNAERGVSRGDYWEQVHAYAQQVVTLAEADENRLATLAARLDQVPDPEFEQAALLLAEKARSVRSPDVRFETWRALQQLAARHARHPEAEWSMKEVRVKAIEATAASFAPEGSVSEYWHLFSRSNYELFNDVNDWDLRQERLQAAQIVAAVDVWNKFGLEGIRDLSADIENPFALGWALGASGADISTGDLRPLTSTSEHSLEFVAGYLSGGHSIGNRPLSSLDFTAWAPEEIADAFGSLRLSDPVSWRVAEALLGNEKQRFWKKTDVHIIDDPDDLHHAIIELIAAGRPAAAIRAIHTNWYRTKLLNVSDASAALMAAVSTHEPVGQMDGYSILSLIQALQRSTAMSEEEIAAIEWAYLDLLSKPGDASPLVLERKLSADPEFFCEVVRVIFRPENAPTPSSEPSPRDRQLASSAYRLLMEWKTPPGQLSNGDFDGHKFASWLEKVVKRCTDTGHLVVALHQVGPVLVHVPADASGFWIDLVVAQQLNRSDMQELRSGYRTGIFNSRGAHWVDPSGAPELELASEYFERAEQADIRGLVRLATSMRQLAKEYESDAKRIKDTHGYEDLT